MGWGAVYPHPLLPLPPLPQIVIAAIATRIAFIVVVVLLIVVVAIGSTDRNTRHSSPPRIVVSIYPPLFFPLFLPVCPQQRSILQWPTHAVVTPTTITVVALLSTPHLTLLLCFIRLSHQLQPQPEQRRPGDLIQHHTRDHDRRKVPPPRPVLEVHFLGETQCHTGLGDIGHPRVTVEFVRVAREVPTKVGAEKDPDDAAQEQAPTNKEGARQRAEVQRGPGEGEEGDVDDHRDVFFHQLQLSLRSFIREIDHHKPGDHARHERLDVRLE